MNFSGKYQLQSQENFEPFMKAMGIAMPTFNAHCGENWGQERGSRYDKGHRLDVFELELEEAAGSQRPHIRPGVQERRFCGGEGRTWDQGEKSLPDDLIQKGRDIKGISEIEHNGKHVKLTLTYGPKVVKNEFTLGEECELETMSGEKVKAVVTMEGDNKMVTSFKGMKSVTELNGDTITNTMTLGDIVYKRVSKRI